MLHFCVSKSTHFIKFIKIHLNLLMARQRSSSPLKMTNQLIVRSAKSKEFLFSEFFTTFSLNRFFLYLCHKVEGIYWQIYAMGNKKIGVE